MKKENIIGTVVLGAIALGTAAVLGYRYRDEIQEGAEKLHKSTMAKADDLGKLANTKKKEVQKKTDEITKNIKIKTDDLNKNVQEGKKKLVKKLDGDTPLNNFIKEVESKLKGDKVSPKELSRLKDHFEQFSLDNEQPEYVMEKDDLNADGTFTFDDNDYTIEREEYPNKEG